VVHTIHFVLHGLEYETLGTISIWNRFMPACICGSRNTSPYPWAQNMQTLN